MDFNEKDGVEEGMIQSEVYLLDHIHTIQAPIAAYLQSPATRPDAWLAPAQLWRITYSHFCRSPRYLLGRGYDGKKLGIGVKHPAFKSIECQRTENDQFENKITTTQSILNAYFCKQDADDL